MKEIFVTYLGTDDFLPGVLVLSQSVKQHNHKYKLLILISESVSISIVELLSKNGFNIKIIKSIQNPNELYGDERNYKHTYTKLRIFELYNYSKLVYLDADMIICENIEQLFDKPHLSAVSAGSLLPQNRLWRDLNSGLMVLVPTRQLCNQVVKAIDSLPSKDGGDQGFLHSFFYEWPVNKNLHLEHKYNVPAGYLNEYCSTHSFEFSYGRKTLKTNIAAIHFFGALKPWNISMKYLKRKTDDKIEQALFLWWDTYKNAINNLRAFDV
jgi:alpha-N-acetylglucosamine transferase